MIFTNNKFKKLSQPFKVNIDGINVEQVTEAEFLGIIVTENLSWNSHIKTIKHKESKSIIIRKIRQNMPCEVLRNLYFTLVNPYFEYCNVIWAVNRTVSLESQFRMKKIAIRVVSNSK